MDNSGNNTILPLPSCEDVELFNLFQQNKWNYLSRAMLTAEIEMQSPIMANDAMLLTPAIVTA